MLIKCMIVASAGKTGHLRQAEAVAGRLGTQHRVITSSSVTIQDLDMVSDVHVVLAAGRQSIAPPRRLRKLAAPGPLLAVLQPVVWRPSDFDVIWAPIHDRARHWFGAGPRLVETLTAPSAITDRLAQQKAAWLRSAFPIAGAPIVGVLLGGRSSAHRCGTAEIEELAARLQAFASLHDATLLVTTSRRSPEGAAALIRERLGDPRHLVFDALNPGSAAPADVYAGIIGLADAFVVSNDSVAMLSEAAANGKPIYAWRLPGGKAKFERVYTGLQRHGALRWFDGSLDRWSYPPLDAAGVVAGAIRDRLGFTSGPGERI